MNEKPPDNRPRVAACVVTYNSAGCVGACLDALFAQAGVHAEAVVLDNASTDASAEIAAKYERATVIRAMRNTGFAAGANAAFAATDAPYVLFLNPDAVLIPGALERLACTLESSPEDVAAVQPKLVRKHKKVNSGQLTVNSVGSACTLDAAERIIDSAGIVLSLRNLSPYDRGSGEIDAGQYDREEEIFGPTAACTLWRRTALEHLRINGQIFDESFFAYYEDVDLAWRASRLGFRFLYVPSATATHDRKNPPFHGGKTDARAFANRCLMLIGNAPAGLLACTLIRNLPRECARWLYKTATRPGFFEAWRHLARGIPAALRKRRVMKSLTSGRG